jgi:hypothetical protein
VKSRLLLNVIVRNGKAGLALLPSKPEILDEMQPVALLL